MKWAPARHHTHHGQVASYQEHFNLSNKNLLRVLVAIFANTASDHSTNLGIE
jgi:hypothetical protein